MKCSLVRLFFFVHVAIADGIRLQLISELKAVFRDRKMAMTTDIWQDKFKKISYISLTAHFYEANDDGFNLKEEIICMQPLEVGVTKTAEYLRSIIMDKLKNLEIEDHIENIVFTTDRGTNIVKALENLTRINCFPHLCNNLVKKMCNFASAKNQIELVTSIVKYFQVDKFFR